MLSLSRSLFPWQYGATAAATVRRYILLGGGRRNGFLGVGGDFFATLFLRGCVIGSKFFVCDEEDENWRNANLCRETICAWRISTKRFSKSALPKSCLRQLDGRISKNDNLNNCHQLSLKNGYFLLCILELLPQ
jgi:hypothetical protein